MSLPALPQFAERLGRERFRLERSGVLQLFLEDTKRAENFSVNLDELVFDFSKNLIDEHSLALLVDMAKKAGLEARCSDMFSGKKINTTESRAVLHTALRNRSGEPVLVDGKDVMPDVLGILNRLETFSHAVRDGTYQVSGGKVRDVVNIGIGGSDLGPRMVVQALAPYHDGPRVHFVANVDGADLSDTLSGLDLSTTLFIVASKTFTTQETMTNANSAFRVVKEIASDKAADHFCALSTNLEATRAFGIPDERTFGFWDWVGGRYSVWSAIGLSVMLAIGSQNFSGFLAGAHSADVHFRDAPMRKNIPVLMALLGIWHRNIFDLPAVAVLPYDDRLARFPAWLQQLDMESNGKSVTHHATNTTYMTGPVVFGEPGTNGQHAFYQLIHQGTTVIPCDFLVAANPSGTEKTDKSHHRLLLANCLAQSEALMLGRSLEEAEGNAHKVFSGNRPSNTFLYKKLDPHTLGMLMAFYEHKVFVQGVIWDINSFDQWGVELGKQLAKGIDQMLENGDSEKSANGSTRKLLETIYRFQE